MKYTLLIFLACSLYNCGDKKTRTIQAKIFMSDFDSANLNRDIKLLHELPYVIDARFYSKEDAKKEYIGAGNDDWSKILDEKPLPDSYELTVNFDKLPNGDIVKFKEEIHARIENVQDIAVSSLIILK